ncbi:Crp/Fnr family transcriptional regulator [Sphingomonas sp. MMS24-J13]|uniref:Crp/Fnr family transcriptional regulator n=1 Tax=Sphingomonas sp. MMS24-J13 TaxID=3238686 RepID=UPI00384C7BD0
MIIQSSLSNLLLRALSASDFATLAVSLTRVELPRRCELVLPNQVIEHCWFPEEGIASIVATSSDDHEAEAGVVGRDGVVDVATVLGIGASTNYCVIQVSGYAHRVPADALKGLLNASADARRVFNGYAYSLLTQVSNTALANATYTVEQRLARWLLICSDRVGRDEIALTHDLLSIMLNVRRAGVTTTIQSLVRLGALTVRRGVIVITDREALTRLVPGGYTPI